MKNYGIYLPWMGMPLFLNVVVSNIVLFLNLDIDSIVLKVTSFALLKVGWLVVILTPSSVEWYSSVIWGILPSKGVFHAAPFLTMLHKFL